MRSQKSEASKKMVGDRKNASIETPTLSFVWRRSGGRNRPSAGGWGRVPPRLGFPLGDNLRMTHLQRQENRHHLPLLRLLPHNQLAPQSLKQILRHTQTQTQATRLRLKHQ